MIFFLMIRRPPRSTRTAHSFPTRRSSDLDAPPGLFLVRPLDIPPSLMGEAARLASLLASRSGGGAVRPGVTAQGRTITPIQLRLAASRQGCVSFPHQGGRLSLTFALSSLPYFKIDRAPCRARVCQYV